MLTADALDAPMHWRVLLNELGTALAEFRIGRVGGEP